MSQLIWREFFYAMSANNPFYGEMERNPICINIPWYDNDKQLEAYMNGNTGYPFIDAGVRQMKKEGWTHHIVRNALSMFLTRYNVKNELALRILSVVIFADKCLA